MRILATIVVFILVVVGGALGVVYSGIYNVGTNNHDLGWVNWTLDTAMTRSVEHHAKGIAAPPLTDEAMIKTGFHHYNEMCVSCHGAPGVPPDEIAQGLWPKAPNLVKTARDWTTAQLYWIIKNGIKFTSMPAWGPSHSDKELWAMTAFVQQLPTLSAADYKKMQEEDQKAKPSKE